jgi:hypothetical protein
MLLSDTAVTSSSKTLISSYQPFYLPKEDTLPASESLAAAKRNYQMQVVTSLRRSPEEIARFVAFLALGRKFMIQRQPDSA